MARKNKNFHHKQPPHARPDGPKASHTVIYGLHACKAALQNPNRHIYRVYLAEGGKDRDLETLIPRHLQPTRISRADFDRLTGRDAVHQGIALEVDPLSPPHLDDVLPNARLLLMLDQVTDPHNIGAILRSAAAFGADALIVQDRHSPAQTAVMAKVACGALESVPMVPVTNLARTLDDLQQAGFRIYGLDERGETLADHHHDEKVVLVLGAEGEGLRRLVAENCDALVKLPTSQAMASLNVSNAAAVALYHFRKNSA